MKKPLLPYELILMLLMISGCRVGTEDIVASDSVAELLPVEIGGMQQWLLIKGENKENPVLLWLHGGPGSAQMQAELRQAAIGRFGFTVFAGTGEVWNRFENFSLDHYKWTAGVGLRFNLNKDDPTNIRIDYGTGKRTSGFYLQFGEAF